jgi:hypothetical protein
LPGYLLAELFDLAHSLRLGSRGLKASLSVWDWVLIHFKGIRQGWAMVQAGRTGGVTLLESCEMCLLYREFREGQALHGVGKIVNALLRLNGLLAIEARLK